MLVWLSVWSKVLACIWPSWCHCHSLSVASVKSRLVLPFWYRLTWVVPEKEPLNGCVCVCVCKMCSHLCYQHICITAECNIVVTGTYLLMLVYCVTVVTVYIFLCRCIFYTTIGAILLPCMKSLHCLLYTLRLWLQGVICMLYESSVTWAMFYSNIAEPTPIQQYHRLQKVGDLWQNFVKSRLCNRSQLLCL